MTPRKLNKAFALAGITMPTVRAHIERNLAAAALSDLTAKQIAAVIGIHHTAYTQGRASCGASVEDDAVWVGSGVDKLIPLAALAALDVQHTRETTRESRSTYADGLRNAATGKFVSREEFFSFQDQGVKADYYIDVPFSTTTYKLDYQERV